MDGVLVGATSMGPCGGEVLAALTLAVHARIPVRTLKEMIYAYPTFHRADRLGVVGLGAARALTSAYGVVKSAKMAGAWCCSSER